MCKQKIKTSNWSYTYSRCSSSSSLGWFSSHCCSNSTFLLCYEGCEFTGPWFSNIHLSSNHFERVKFKSGFELTFLFSPCNKNKLPFHGDNLIEPIICPISFGFLGKGEEKLFHQGDPLALILAFLLLPLSSNSLNLNGLPSIDGQNSRIVFLIIWP